MATRRPRLLVLCWDPLTDSMAGPAIRAWHLALQLVGAGEVVLAGTGGVTRRHPALVTVDAAGGEGLADLFDGCDAVFAPTSVAARYPWIARSDKPLCIDMYIPTHLENLEASGVDPGSPSHHEAVAHQVRVIDADLRRGDFFLCASERQRDMWLGALGAVGRLNPGTYLSDPTLRSLVDVVPFGLDPADAPTATGALRRQFPVIAERDPVLVWGGGVYNWFDPLSAVQAVDRLRHRRPGLRLVFLGLRNPNPDIPEMTMVSRLRALTADLGLTGSHVLFNEGWMPYAERGAYLAAADIGISTHLEHIETHFSFRTRVLDYLWAGLPCLLTGGDTLSDAVAAAGLGVAVAPGDVEAIASGIDRLLADPPPRPAVHRFAQGYSWSRVAGPLVAWGSRPAPAADRPSGAGAAGENPAPVGAAGERQPPSAGAGPMRGWVRGRRARTGRGGRP